MQKPFLALVLALVTVLVGCSRGAAPAAGGKATIDDTRDLEPQVTIPKSPNDVATPIDDQALRGRVSSAMQKQGVKLTEQEPYIYATHLGPVPKGASRIIAATAGLKLFLFSADAAGSTVQLLGSADGALMNEAKLWLKSDESFLWIWSQAPAKATEVNAVVQWDGTSAKLVARKTTDPTAEHFTRQGALLAKGDIEGLVNEGDGPLYPTAYPEHYTLPKPILQLAYDRSLAAYKASDLKAALRYLQYGLDQYTAIYGGLGENHPAGHQQDQLTTPELVPIVNDYAFFLAESHQPERAKPLLERVIAAAPERVVAYLNLADVQWALGEQAQARPNYRKYLELLGANRSVAPARVLDRAK